MDDQMFCEKQVVLGVTGSIAAFKAVALTSTLRKRGVDVRVILTEAAREFVGEASFRALSHNPVISELFAVNGDVPHIELAQRADLMVVAPATAQTLAKLAHGLADNALCATALALDEPPMVVPAMNHNMYENPATQANLKTLRSRGFQVVEPVEGRLASGDSGKGRMVGVEEIADLIFTRLGKGGPLSGAEVVVTAGGTREFLDPVRFLGNPATGKMGYAIAEVARDLGGRVTLISANSTLRSPRGMRVEEVSTSDDMAGAVDRHLRREGMKVLVMAAAVGDYKPKERSAQKIKKDEREELQLPLAPTVDILKEAADGRDDVIKVGFAAETENLLENAADKLHEKKLDLIVANDITREDSGFGTDTNKVTIYDGRSAEELELMSKREVAVEVMKRVSKFLRDRTGKR